MKNPRIKTVKAELGYELELEFDSGERKKFDVKPYLEFGFFKELKDINYFCKVRPFMGTIQWPHGQDFCPDTLYEKSH
ncbi:MAG: DUF2442 domain-containing protein [Deltaproteobacteria bacterium]|nr:DUF2442 domain-containing protein [Deltaproteobacteria bacterium]